jgi:hypothetical protein
MTTLVISAPHLQKVINKKRSFDVTVKTGIGSGYIMSHTDLHKAETATDVIVLSKDEKRNAVGKLRRKITRSSIKAPKGKIRYDVHIDGLEEVPRSTAYLSIKLNRNGVAIL